MYKHIISSVQDMGFIIATACGDHRGYWCAKRLLIFGFVDATAPTAPSSDSPSGDVWMCVS